jgi:ubiquinone/menaquinone biosynthesis C-methylase UbiE
MLRADITDLPFDDNRFDAIYCSHVLEHVPDDRKAMSELRRVLRPGGWAVLQVPIKLIVTYEDSAVTTPEDRERVFGQSDHVRIYGLDYKDRLREVGFKVTIVQYAKELSEEDLRLSAISRDEDIYLCEK